MASVVWIKSNFSSQLSLSLKKIFQEMIKKSNRVVVVQRLAPPRAMLDIELTKQVIGVLISLSAKPFLYDSPKKEGPLRSAKEYLRQAKENGYTRQACSCPVIVGDDPFITKVGSLKIGLCRDIYESDALIVLNRFTGSQDFGANTALRSIVYHGCVSSTKKMISELVEKEKTKTVQKQFRKSDKQLAEIGKVLLSKFGKKLVVINDARRISLTEGVIQEPGKNIARSCGIFLGRDVVAVDTATVNAVVKKNGSVFTKSSKLNPIFHLQEAEKVCMGSCKFELLKEWG